MPKPIKGNGRYMAGLDGLRALAVFAVIAYHLNLGFAPGGLLGVGVFFVLSGYLITDILVAQWKDGGRLEMKDFWIRRARRLLPALLLMIVIVVIWITLFSNSQLLSLRGDVVAALLYVSNWWLIFHHVSYFQSFGPPSPLGHLWSLAVEEQFYLLWPLLLAIGLRVIRRKGWLSLLSLGLAAASAIAMAVLYQPGTDPSRVYYGTDTRAFALLIGAALAFVWPSRKLSKKLSFKSRFLLDVSGLIGLIVILLMIWKSNEYDDSLYRGGMVWLSLATALTVAVLAHPASTLAKVMGCAPLRWLGVRSYGIYLWHYPVIVLTSPVVDTNGLNVTRAVVQVAASILLAALSWKYIEEPIRRGAIGKFIKQLRSRERRKQLRLGRVFVSGCAMMGLGVFCVGMAEPIHSVVPAAETQVVSISPTTTPTKYTSSGTGTPTPTHTTTDVAKGSSTQHKTANGPVSGQGVTALGDSVMVDAAPYLQKLLPGIVVDAQVGRQMYQLPAVVAELKAEGKLGNRIIIETGTNGPFTIDQFNALLKEIGPVQQIVLVNSRVPRSWQSTVNTTLSSIAKSHSNITLVDWYSASAGKNWLFYPDGVHLPPQGAQYYASIVAKVVQPAKTSNVTTQSPSATSVMNSTPSVSGQGVTAMGDSVMVDAAPYLQKLLPGIVVDAKVGLQMYQLPAVVAQLKAEGELGNRIIIETGTNGPFTKSQFIDLLNSLGPVKQIILVNSRVPRSWQTVVNSTLADVASTYPHTTLVDWYSASAGKNSLFYPDGVHLPPQGAQYYASLVAQAVKP